MKHLFVVAVVAQIGACLVMTAPVAAQSGPGRPLDISPSSYRAARQARLPPRPVEPRVSVLSPAVALETPRPAARPPAPAVPEATRQAPARVAPPAAPVPLPPAAAAPEPDNTGSVTQTKEQRTPPPESQLAKAYCANIVDAAAQARAAWQARQLMNLEEQLSRRIQELEIKRAEYQKWFERQEEARKKADESVVAIFSRMRPDSAASQLAVMEEASAVALLAKLHPRAAGAILNEMSAAKAARLADSMSGASRTP